MRRKLLGLVTVAGLVAASALPALACPYHNQTNASNEQYTPRQTAQADTQSSDAAAQQ